MLTRELLKTLKSTEWEELNRFLPFRFPRMRADVLLGLNAFKKNQSDSISRKDVHLWLYPQKPFDDKVIRYLLTDINKVVFEYFSFKQLTKQPQKQQSLLLQELSDRKCHRAFDKTYNQELNRAETQGHVDSDALHYRYELYSLKAKEELDSGKRSSDVFEESSLFLDLYFVAKKLQISAEKINLNFILKKEWNDPFLKTILEQIDNGLFNDSPYIKLLTITPIAEGAILFDVTFGDETEDPSSLENGENISHTYAEGTYTVSATAYGITGLETTVAQELVVSFKAPANLEVTIENDSAISKRVNVTATAEYAITFDVYSGVTDDTTPVSGNIGEVVALDYEEPGTYTITVVAKSAAIETVEYMVEFEVTAIVAPLTAAPTPPSRDAENVVSIYSDAYTDVTLSEVNPGWGQSTVLTEVQVEENNTWFYSNLDYTGIVTDYGNATDVSAMEYVHFDYWTPDATVLGLKLVNTSYETGDPLKEHIEFVNPISLGSWVSVDIPLENFLNDTSGITQLLFDTTGNNAIVYTKGLCCS